MKIRPAPASTTFSTGRSSTCAPNPIIENTANEAINEVPESANVKIIASRTTLLSVHLLKLMIN